MQLEKLIGARLQAVRVSKQIKQETAAQKLGISQSRLSRIENGQLLNISLAVIMAYCRLLEISVIDILS